MVFRLRVGFVGSSADTPFSDGTSSLDAEGGGL